MSALAIVAEGNPHTGMLRLTFSPWAEQFKEETILNILDGPYRLLESVKMLLGSGTTTECFRSLSSISLVEKHGKMEPNTTD